MRIYKISWDGSIADIEEYGYDEDVYKENSHDFESDSHFLNSELNSQHPIRNKQYENKIDRIVAILDSIKISENYKQLFIEYYATDSTIHDLTLTYGYKGTREVAKAITYVMNKIAGELDFKDEFGLMAIIRDRIYDKKIKEGYYEDL